MAEKQRGNGKVQIQPRFGEPISKNVFLLLLPLYLALISSSALALRTPPPLPVLPIPTAQQLSWQEKEMAMFFHFGPNTFTDSEWGTGHAPPSVFNPTGLNVTQWVHVAKDSGFSRVILTAKHHDGFCLWPSEYTNYSVRSSPWRNGSGDVVSELSKAADEAGIGLGLYLSPWDRHEEVYGRTVAYNEFYLGQLRELLTRYGAIKEVWLDGAKGEGEKDMDYLFDSWFSLIHQLQPGSVIFSDAGPDSRWIGDESGVSGKTCWSLFNTSDAKIGNTDPKYSQQGDPSGYNWVPPECDVSIRPGWFWHPTELPKSALTLLNLYFKSVGRNCLLLLNVPPNKSGLISDQDIQVLRQFDHLRRAIFSNNLAKAAFLNASTTRGGSNSPFAPKNVLQEGIYTYWAPKENRTRWVLNLEFTELVSFNVLQLQEPIQMGQRVSEFHLDAFNGEGEWRRVVNGTTIGYKRLLQFPMVTGRLFRVVIAKSREDPLIAHLGIYINNFVVRGGLDSDHRLGQRVNGSQIVRQVTHNSSCSSTVEYV